MRPTHSCFAPHAWPPERGSAGAQAHTLDRQDRGDDDDDYKDKLIMVDDGLLRYTGVQPNKGTSPMEPITNTYGAYEVTVEKGVLGKDGKPFAPATLHVVTKDGWQYPYDYTPIAMMAAFLNNNVTSIILINEQNEQHTIKK